MTAARHIVNKVLQSGDYKKDPRQRASNATVFRGPALQSDVMVLGHSAWHRKARGHSYAPRLLRPCSLIHVPPVQRRTAAIWRPMCAWPTRARSHSCAASLSPSMSAPALPAHPEQASRAAAPADSARCLDTTGTWRAYQCILQPGKMAFLWRIASTLKQIQNANRALYCQLTESK